MHGIPLQPCRKSDGCIEANAEHLELLGRRAFTPKIRRGWYDGVTSPWSTWYCWGRVWILAMKIRPCWRVRNLPYVPLRSSAVARWQSEMWFPVTLAESRAERAPHNDPTSCQVMAVHSLILLYVHRLTPIL